MTIIPRRLHIVFDLLYIIFLLGYPLLFVRNIGPGSLVLLVSGTTVLCYSLMTKYEFGIFKLINMKVHLTIDFILGLALASSPWVLDFGKKLMWPHIAIGILMMLTAIFSSNKPINIPEQEKTFTF